MVFNPDDHKEMGGYEPMPAGDYVCILAASERKATKAGNGHYLKLEFHVVEGTFKGKHLWANLNLDNPNHKAVEIAFSELSTICRAVGVAQLQDEWHPSELGGRPMLIKVGVRKSNFSGEMENYIKFYDKVGSGGEFVAESGGSFDPPALSQGMVDTEDDGLPF